MGNQRSMLEDARSAMPRGHTSSHIEFLEHMLLTQSVGFDRNSPRADCCDIWHFAAGDGRYTTFD